MVAFFYSPISRVIYFFMESEEKNANIGGEDKSMSAKKNMKIFLKCFGSQKKKFFNPLRFLKTPICGKRWSVWWFRVDFQNDHLDRVENRFQKPLDSRFHQLAIA